MVTWVAETCRRYKVCTIYFHTLKRILSLVLLYLIAQCTVMDYLKFHNMYFNRQNLKQNGLSTTSWDPHSIWCETFLRNLFKLNVFHDKNRLCLTSIRLTKSFNQSAVDTYNQISSKSFKYSQWWNLCEDKPSFHAPFDNNACIVMYKSRCTVCGA
jgi:hypothetical protein